MNRKPPHAIDKHVGNRLRMRRLVLHMTQEELAQKLGITYQQVQKYEKGTNRISGSRLHQIASALDVPVGFFFEDAIAGDPSGSELPLRSNVAQFVASADGLALAKAFTALPVKVRRGLVRFVETLSNTTR